MKPYLLAIFTLILLLVSMPTTYAQTEGQNPTPVVIHLTPSPTAMPAFTPTPSILPDPFEPNNNIGQPTPLQSGTYHLTLPPADVDYFAGILQVGQILQIQLSSPTHLPQATLFWGGQPVAVGTQFEFTAPMSGNYTLQIEPTTNEGTTYDLTVAIQSPPATSSPTSTPTTTPSPTPTTTPVPAIPTWLPPTATIIWVSPTPVWTAPTPTALLPTSIPNATRLVSSSSVPIASSSRTVTATFPITQSTPITETIITLPFHPLPVLTTPTPATLTTARVLVYYDANNDRAPSPGEGIPNVSVVAVDTQGQPLAQHFTNSQGEVQMQLTSDTISRVIVPFVPGWSTRIRAGQANSDIVLGLPAVRLPVFFPVQMREAN